jgi:heme exporter protein C
LLLALGAVALVLGVVSLAGTFLYAPADSIQGDVQRIFYLHVPLALCAYLAAGLTAAGGVAYLATRRMLWDVIARSAAECAVLFTSVVLVTGSLWGKPVWGTWWAWDARLTSTLMLWFIFVGYLMLRSYIGDTERAARYSVIVGVLGALDVPLVHVSVEWWRTLHPQGILDSATGSPALPASMLAVFAASSVAILCTFGLILGLRIWLELIRERITSIEEDRLSVAASPAGGWTPRPATIGPEAIRPARDPGSAEAG